LARLVQHRDPLADDRYDAHLAELETRSYE
jgi:hypothetical protein